MREVERAEVGARDLDGREPGGEERPVEEVELRGDRERQRADREQEPAHAESTDPDEHRDEAREARAEDQRPRERDTADAAVDDAEVVPADVRRQPADERRRGRARRGRRTPSGRARAGRPSRSAPSTETAHSAKAAMIVQVWCCSDLSTRKGARRRRAARGRRRTAGGVSPTRSRAAVRGSRRRAARTGSSRRRTRSSRRLTRATSTSTTRNSTNCTRPVSVVKLKKSTRSTIPMTIAAEHGARERHHAADERGGHAAQQRVGPDVHEVGRALVGRGEDHRDRREEPGDRPDAGRHHLRADAGQPREVGVGRGRAHRVAERGVPEQPPQPERDERHDDRARAAGSRSTSMSRPGSHVKLERQRELGLQRPGAVLGQRERDRLAELGDADRRDEHDHARRLEEPADHRQLDEHAGERAERPARRRATASTASRGRPPSPRTARSRARRCSPTAKLMTRLDR